MLADLLAGQARVEPPNYSGRGLVNVAATLYRHFGGGESDLLAPLVEDVLPAALLDGVQTVVLLLVDGLGHAQFQRGLESGDLPGLASILRDGGQLSALTSVFPSATMSALASLHTGLPPARHGVLGWTMFLEE